MPDNRGRKGSDELLLPKKGRAEWAREKWQDRAEIAALPHGAWMLREPVPIPTTFRQTNRNNRFHFEELWANQVKYTAIFAFDMTPMHDEALPSIGV